MTAPSARLATLATKAAVKAAAADPALPSWWRAGFESGWSAGFAEAADCAVEMYEPQVAAALLRGASEGAERATNLMLDHIAQAALERAIPEPAKVTHKAIVRDSKGLIVGIDEVTA